MRTVGAQVIFNGLLVANVDKQLLKNARFAVFPYRNKQSTLKHILQ